jgi:hypothetical protein
MTNLNTHIQNGFKLYLRELCEKYEIPTQAFDVDMETGEISLAPEKSPNQSSRGKISS